jgi:tetratricopeptide (TPR) repeat protein
MTEAAERESGLPHAVFLRRLAGASSPASPAARLSQGAFLALRLVDLLELHAPVYADAFRYQHAATERFCRDLPGDHIETAHLVGLTRGAADAFQEQDIRLVLPALLAYSHHLEDELLLHEALDVLETTARVAGDRLGLCDAVALRLRMGRAFRKLNQFDDADRLYAEAGALAVTGSDRHSEVVSRLGRAYTLVGRGNLLDAERRLRELLEETERLGDRRGQALTHQGLGVVLGLGGRPTDAIPHTWAAFGLYEDDPSRTGVLADLGVLLLTVGDAAGAERALSEVVRRGGTRDAVQNAMVELMHCASYRRDRVGFERWRERCEAARDDMPPNILADFHLKLGIGRARFGQLDRAEEPLKRALRLAEDAGLHELVFRVERIQTGLRDCAQELCATPEAAAEPVPQSDAVREVSASLAQLEA